MKKTFLPAAMAAFIILTGCAQDETVNSESEVEIGATRAEIGQVVINEIKVSDFGTDVKDWIELYNTTDQPVFLEGLILMDQGGGIFPLPNITIDGKKFVVFEEDATGSFTFGLGKSDEIVYLYDILGTEFDRAEPTVTLNDNVNPAWARIPDGGLVWSDTAFPTKGAANRLEQAEEPGVSDFKDELVINEVKVSGFGNDVKDWIELRNTTGGDIEILNFRLTDAGGSFIILDNISVPANGYYVFEEDAPGSFTFGLGKTGEVVSFYDNDGDLIDTIELEGTFEDNIYPAYARRQDGGQGWAQTAEPTRGAINEIVEYVDPNPTTDYSNLFINEVKASQAGIDDDDFIELYNAGTEPIEIGGLKIYDGGGFAKAWTIPTGTTIAAGGFKAFTENIHFSFGLKADGSETVTLATSADEEIDYVALPALPDNSTPAYARIPDGTENWETVSTPTKESSNN